MRYSANHDARKRSWPIRARLASQNDELCNNRRVSERSNNNVQYVENNVFWTLNHINIALKITLFYVFGVVTSYDPFK